MYSDISDGVVILVMCIAIVYSELYSDSVVIVYSDSVYSDSDSGRLYGIVIVHSVYSDSE